MAERNVASFEAAWPGGLQEEALNLQTGLTSLPDELLPTESGPTALVPEVRAHFRHVLQDLWVPECIQVADLSWLCYEGHVFM